jgi:hypothetical protein
MNQLKMADVQSIVTLHSRGWSRRRIARELGVDRETVGRYLRLSGSSPGGVAIGVWDSNPASAPAGNEQAPEARPAEVAVQNQPNAPPGSTGSQTGLAGSPQAGSVSRPSAVSRPSGAPSRCEPWRVVIGQKLEQGHTAQRIYQDLVADHGYAGSYYSVLRLARKLLSTRELPHRRMEVEAGVEAQVDFGRGAPIVCAEGKRKAT